MTEPPLVLGIESATARVGCAVGGPDGVLASVVSAEPRRHAESLVSQIQLVADQSGVPLKQLSAVAVDIGPGLYTGLRVGVTTAMALAYTLDVPMVAFTSLELIANSVRHLEGRIDVVIDARRSEVFHAAFDVSSVGVERLTEPTVLPPEELIIRLGGQSVTTRVLGDGLAAHADLFTAAGWPADENLIVHPDPAIIVELAVVAVAAGATAPADTIRPLYLRGPDAQPNWSMAR